MAKGSYLGGGSIIRASIGYVKGQSKSTFTPKPKRKRTGGKPLELTEKQSRKIAETARKGRERESKLMP